MTSTNLRVAIVGAGPGGLATAIALSAVPNVEVTVYEQATKLREIGSGITIGLNGWRVLELLGAADAVTGHRRIIIDHRRVRRTRLQSALLDRVPEGIIQLGKRLKSLDDLKDGGVGLKFEDGTSVTADMLVGADGIRSVTREKIFPDHKTTFTGTTYWRTLIPWEKVATLPQLNDKTTWFHSPVGFVMTTPVDDPTEVDRESGRLFEVSVRKWADPNSIEDKIFAWGVDATNKKILSNLTEYGPIVQDVLNRVPEGVWREYSAFAGPRLESLTGWNKVVLLGDASHPLSGAFGSGAAFAMEDGWLLARAVEHSRKTGDRPTPELIAEILEIFDSIRSPYYSRMYDFFDREAAKSVGAKRNAAAANISEWEAQLRVTINGMIGEGQPWIYLNDIKEVWAKYLRGEVGDAVVPPPIFPDSESSWKAF
ncbi:hypothetical protein EsH8_XI_000094 [Colletotrichum jinshuiense]